MKVFLKIVIATIGVLIATSCSKDEEIIPTPTPVKTTIKIGDKFAGGIVFFVEPNGEHGLMTYQSDLIVGGATFENAFTLCDNFQTTMGSDPKIYDDWYLPTVVELQKLYLQKTQIGGFINSYYWTSTEDLNDVTIAYYVDFNPNQGGAFPGGRTQKFNVRPIRRF